MTPYLIYIGDGSFLPDVPAQNLNEDEARRFGIEFLLASKLYRMAETPTAAAVKPSAKVSKDDLKEK